MTAARHVATALALALLVGIAPGGAAQADLYRIDAAVLEPQVQYELPVRAQHLDVPILFRDLSQDSPNTAVPGVPDGQDVPWIRDHSVTVRAEILSADSGGWSTTLDKASFMTFAGQEEVVVLRATVTPPAMNPFLQVLVNFTMQPQAQPEVTKHASVLINFFSRGVPGMNAIAGIPAVLDLGPSDVGTLGLRLTNAGTQPRTFGFVIADNPCGLFAVPPADATMQASQTSNLAVSVRAPEDKFWYYAEQCPLRVGVFAKDNPENVVFVNYNVVVDGFWVAPERAFVVATAAAVLFVLFLFLKRRKERLEEEILGKPQKPWLIPVEQVYLKHLRKRDERAWYMVRHHLMAEEYQSALLWYKHFKQATRGQRTRERVVLRHERAYEHWKERWARKIAKPERDADRYEAKLQKGLDREANARLRRERRKHKSLVAKMRQAHEKKVERLEERHAKAVKKAQKKGLAPPPAPMVDEPDYPPEPTLQRVLLADHKLHKKAERARRKAVRKRGDLEVRFEKKDARRLQSMRRKVQRIARKIDDPDFIAEHPLLSGDRT